MANTRNQNLFNTVRGTLGQLTGKGGRGSRGRNTRGGGLASQATDFIGGFLSGGEGKGSRGRSASRRRTGSAGRRRR
jgi:hypothetical protein